MDKQLRFLLNQFTIDQTPETAIDFIMASIRSDPENAIALVRSYANSGHLIDNFDLYPMGSDEIFSRARARQQLIGEQQIFPEDRHVLIDEDVAFSFDDLFRDRFVNMLDEFLDTLSSAVSNIPISDMGYQFVGVNRFDNVVFINITGYVVIENGEELFSENQTLCPFCQSDDLNAASDSHILGVQCNACEFEWLEPLTTDPAVFP